MKKQNREIKLNDLGIFRYNDFGFDIDLKEGFHSIKWNEIERLQAYKVDLTTTDEVCLDITFNNKAIIITEETNGWYQFLNKLKSSLPLSSDWEALVLKSPFEYDLTTIYEREDRKMPLKTNFYSIIKDKTKEEISHAFEKQGWTTRKSSSTDFKIENSWTDLDLESDDEGLLLHGLIAFYPDNVKIIRQLLDSLNCTYKFEFHDNDQIVEETQNGM